VCGIVGLHLTDPALRARLGALLTPMLVALTGRGPDSAGIALYEEPLPPDEARYCVRLPGDTDWPGLARQVQSALGVAVSVEAADNHGLLRTRAEPGRFRAALAAAAADAVVVGWGQALRIVKDIGAPADICARYGIDAVAGYQGVGHTRMATESAITIDHSHPFAPAADLTLVHNGTFSNYATVRRRLVDAGIGFDTDNDTEVAARFVAHRLAGGDDLAESLRRLLKEFDGFYTLVVASRDEFAVVRDPFACKPLVVAEAPGYVAVASEYHAMADLPGIEDARVFEPLPEEIYAWSR
jgi:glutamate synthase domain-containing protein 1